MDAALAEALGSPGAGRGCSIVYAPTRRGAEEEATRLAAGGWRAAAYHAGMDGARRDAVRPVWIASRLPGAGKRRVVAREGFPTRLRIQ
mgnify:CR=1 FL=1